MHTIFAVRPQNFKTYLLNIGQVRTKVGSEYLRLLVLEQIIEELISYAEDSLFEPLEISFNWKHTTSSLKLGVTNK